MMPLPGERSRNRRQTDMRVKRAKAIAKRRLRTAGEREKMQHGPPRGTIYEDLAVGSNGNARSKCAMNLVSSEPIFRIRAELADIRHFGQTPYGDRRVIDIIGG